MNILRFLELSVILWTENSLINKLFFKKSYTANIDLATGTGKSWVLYGLAAIIVILI